MNSGQSSVGQLINDAWRNDFVNARRIETPREQRFRYGYLCRLIDDHEIAALPEPLRARTRSFHKTSYWKSLSLLRRDAERILKLRRQKMAAQQEWNFEVLVGDYARIHLLLAKLTLAGVSHSIHLGAGLDAARQACLEFEGFLSSASLQPASIAHAA